MPHEKGYDWEISYEIKKEVCFNMNELNRAILHSLVSYSMLA